MSADDTQEYVDILAVLCDTGRSLSLNTEEKTRTLILQPPGDNELIKQVRKHFLRLSLDLPGFCDLCEGWRIRRVVCYWGSMPHVCRICLDDMLTNFEEAERWPKVTIPNTLQ